MQTVLGSRGRGYWVRQRTAPLLAASTEQILSVGGGIRLACWHARQPDPSATVILIHGWLGHAASSYLMSAAAELWQAGFSVVRLNLRDHGATAHLNPDMFHSARINEVVEAVDLLSRDNDGPVGLAGFSLGGNFALRVARALSIETLAICPAIDPPATMTRIDEGAAIYRWFFVRKWQRALREKERAFPDRYNFGSARRLATVNELTELFVREHTEFTSTSAYFDAYSLTGSVLAGTRASILYAADDPVIPETGFDELPASLHVERSSWGGHCAFIEQLSQPTWADRYLVRHFSKRLG